MPPQSRRRSLSRHRSGRRCRRTTRCCRAARRWPRWHRRRFHPRRPTRRPPEPSWPPTAEASAPSRPTPPLPLFSLLPPEPDIGLAVGPLVPIVFSSGLPTGEPAVAPASASLDSGPPLAPTPVLPASRWVVEVAIGFAAGFARAAALLGSNPPLTALPLPPPAAAKLDALAAPMPVSGLTPPVGTLAAGLTLGPLAAPLNSDPRSPLLLPTVVATAPPPANGLPVTAWTEELTALPASCAIVSSNGEALAASVRAYCDAPLFISCTNWAWNDAACALSAW